MTRPDLDVAILGGGCAGLSVATRLAGRGLRQRVVEPREHYHDDRSWSFWTDRDDARPGLKGRWSAWSVRAGGREAVRRSDALSYVTLGAGAFYERALQRLEDDADAELALGAFVHADPVRRDGLWHVETDHGPLSARRVIDTRPRRGPGGYGQYFVGHEVRTDRAVFDASTVLLMDFASPRPDRVDFTYVLPFAPDHALIEATSFAPEPPEPGELEAWLDREVVARTDGAGFETVREERGFIPMEMSARLPASAGPGHTFAGIAGGAARPSTGYAFQRIERQAVQVARAVLRGEEAIAPPPDDRVTRFMDRLFLRVLQAAPQNGPALFQTLFARAPRDRVERFLSGSRAPLDRASVIAAMPPGPFMRQALRP